MHHSPSHFDPLFLFSLLQHQADQREQDAGYFKSPHVTMMGLYQVLAWNQGCCSSSPSSPAAYRQPRPRFSCGDCHILAPFPRLPWKDESGKTSSARRRIHGSVPAEKNSRVPGMNLSVLQALQLISGGSSRQGFLQLVSTRLALPPHSEVSWIPWVGLQSSHVPFFYVSLPAKDSSLRLM